jgi:methylmalonyl-CoA mutase N-terminal domain/subunit
MWAKIMRERFRAQKADSWKMRFHCQTAGSSLTAAQPMNNVVRTAFQALAAVLGGCQSLHTNGLDEALAIPSEEAMRLALRTQQILLEETGVASSIDPLGGSYLVEVMTDRLEREVWGYLEQIDRMGGTLAALERNFFQREIADSAYAYQMAMERGERVVVGVNKYQEPEPEEPTIALHKVDPRAEAIQRERLARVKAGRDGAKVAKLLGELQEVARGDGNLMPPTIECVRAYATGGEIVKVLREVFGRYQETPIF